MTKVLVIDDDSMVRETVVRLLILEGYQVIESAYGQAGYAAAISDSPNIILLDLNMPIMDGFEVLHKLKSNPETERIPVIVLTARIDAESERRCMAAGATDYIKKPWGPAELQERIAIIVGAKELERERYVTQKAKPHIFGDMVKPPGLFEPLP
ncbi:MAG: response regulator [Dehalococcoidia bacterium]|jgi:CheY-like chemotaxis protein|nr:response regulator [Dehalococcoidia bacterium]